MLNILTIFLSNSISWSIHPSDPKIFQLNCLPGWSLVNPLLYKVINAQLSDTSEEPSGKITFIVEDKIHVITNGFILIPEDESQSFINYSAEDRFEMGEKLYRLITYFRFASKQSTIRASSIVSYGHRNILNLGEILFPHKGKEVATSAWHIKTSIDITDIDLVSRKNINNPPPSYDTILQDAIEALFHEDYRTAILFSAFAMENLARMKLTEAFEDGFSKEGRSYKLIFYPENDQELNSKRKSELFNLLIKEARFKQLLHQLPLILLGKSLLKENKALYDKAYKIYERRSQIVHKGHLLGSTFNRLSDIRFASDAIQCATNIVEWFGELGGYANPYERKEGMIVCFSAEY